MKVTQFMNFHCTKLGKITNTTKFFQISSREFTKFGPSYKITPNICNHLPYIYDFLPLSPIQLTRRFCWEFDWYLLAKFANSQPTFSKLAKS